MPLIQGKSKESFSKNVGTEMNAGKDKGQALAIAYSVMRKNRAKKMAKGGEVDDDMGIPSMPMGTDGMNEKPHFAFGGHIADRIRIKHMNKGGMYPTPKDAHYDLGGEVDGIDTMDGGMDDAEIYGESADDLFSDDPDNALGVAEAMEDPKAKRRSMLGSIMKSIKNGM